MNATQSKASRLVKDVGHVDSSAKQDSPVVFEDGLWIGKRIAGRELATLPPIFHEPAIFERTIFSLPEFAERMTLRSGIPVNVSADAIAAAQGAWRNASSNPAAAIPGATGAGSASSSASAPFGIPPSAIGGTSTTANTGIRIVYSGGNFKGLLDTVAARFGIYWKYVNGTVHFFYNDTRTFQIVAIPGDAALTATVASGGSPDGGVSGNGQNTAVKSMLSVYSSIEKSIAIMLSASGKVAASPATGSITVTDTPQTLDRVAQFIDQENKSLARQVMINVTVLAVTITNGDSYGIQWNLIYNDLYRKYGITNTTSSINKAVSFSAAVIGASSKWAGSNLLIEALSDQGKVRRETTASVVTLNHQPVPVQVAKQTAYIKSSQTTLTPNSGAATTFTPGLVNSGFNMTVLPHVLNDGTVMLQFSTDISSLRGFRRMASATDSIESPEVDTRNFLQRAVMKSNETLVISGFEQTDDNLDRKGVGSASNFLLGGGFSAQSSKEIIVILLTPILMDNLRR